jgi:hypothetical protein
MPAFVDECNSSPDTENVLKQVKAAKINVLQHVFCLRHRFQSVTLAGNRFGIAELLWKKMLARKRLHRQTVVDRLLNRNKLWHPSSASEAWQKDVGCYEKK